MRLARAAAARFGALAGFAPPVLREDRLVIEKTQYGGGYARETDASVVAPSRTAVLSRPKIWLQPHTASKPTIAVGLIARIVARPARPTQHLAPRCDTVDT